MQTLENIKKSTQINDNFIKSKIKFDARLREKSSGIITGQPLINMQKAAKAANLPIRDFRPEEGENWKDVNARAREFILNEIIPNWFSSEKIEEEKG